jgi:preprotein translocase subunit SecG
MEVGFMWVVHIVFALMFLLLGTVFMRGKGAFLIAGYNTSSKEEKAKYNEKALCVFMGRIMFLFVVCFLIMATSDLLNSMIPLWIGLALFFCIAIFAVIYANTGNRFRK